MSFITTDIDLILRRLQSGNIAAIPTETVYGLAADYRHENAIEKIFTTKGRPRQHPLILHVLPEWDLNQWVTHIPDEAQQLIKTYWPGPLTIIFPKRRDCISSLITGAQDTVAIRAPKHPITQALLHQLGQPMVAPSANPFEKISPTTAEHVLAHFPDIDLAILDGGRCIQGMESTIIDMAHQPGKILRQGQLQLLEMTEYQATPSTISVPGQHHRHYQPKKPLFYFESGEMPETHLDSFYIICFNKYDELNPHYQFSNDRAQIFYEFYYQLQRASESSYPMILIEKPHNQHALKPIIDRIERAGQPLSLK